MRRAPRLDARFPRAFTVIELLTAIAILAFLVIIVAQILNMSTRATTLSGNQLNNLEKSRRVFDRVGMDLAAALSTQDIPYLVEASPGSSSDKLTFYSQKSGFDSSVRGISQIQYRVTETSGATPYIWERGVVGVDTPPFGGVPTASGALAFQTIADGILRFKVTFMAANTGDMTTTLPVSPARISAVIVTLVVVDDNSLKVFNTSDIQRLANQFPGTISGALSSTNSYYSVWNAALKSLSPVDFSPRLLQAIKVYQTFYEVR